MLIPRQMFPIAAAASSDETLEFINTVHLSREGGEQYGRVRALATDGYHLMCVSLPEPTEAEFPCVKGFAEVTPRRDVELVIRRDSFEQLGKALPKASKRSIPILNNARIAEPGRKDDGPVAAAVTDGATGTVIELRRHPTDAFPDYRQVEPVPNRPAVHVTVGIGLLRQVLDTMSRVHGASQSQGVVIEIPVDLPYTKNDDGEWVPGEKQAPTSVNPVRMWSTDAEGAIVTALVMPMRVVTEPHELRPPMLRPFTKDNLADILKFACDRYVSTLRPEDLPMVRSYADRYCAAPDVWKWLAASKDLRATTRRAVEALIAGTYKADEYPADGDNTTASPPPAAAPRASIPAPPTERVTARRKPSAPPPASKKVAAPAAPKVTAKAKPAPKVKAEPKPRALSPQVLARKMAEILNLGAPNILRLEPSHVATVMSAAQRQGLAGEFRDWLLSKSALPAATAKAVRAWAPTARAVA